VPKKRNNPRKPARSGQPNSPRASGSFPDVSDADFQALMQVFSAGTLGAAGLGAFGRRPPIELPRPPAEATTFRVRVDLRGAKPPIWRRLELSSDLHLDVLHDVLQTAVGWFDCHLHAFHLAGERSAAFLTDYDLEEGEEGTGEADVRLDQVLREVGDRLIYQYDFGDGWEHIIRLEAVSPPAPGDPGARCVAGRRAGPPEDIGGIWAYNGVAASLTGEPGAPALDEHMMEWLPPELDPTAFDVAEVNYALEQLVGNRTPEEIRQARPPRP